MTTFGDYRPSAAEPLLILAMDHRASFGRSLFGVRDDRPDPGQKAAMQAAKQLTTPDWPGPGGSCPGAGAVSWWTSSTGRR
jgi:hypothetical protein